MADYLQALKGKTPDPRLMAELQKQAGTSMHDPVAAALAQFGPGAAGRTIPWWIRLAEMADTLVSKDPRVSQAVVPRGVKAARTAATRGKESFASAFPELYDPKGVHGRINKRDTVFHGTRLEKLKPIQESGVLKAQIPGRYSGTKRLPGDPYDAPYTGGLAVARQPHYSGFRNVEKEIRGQGTEPREVIFELLRNKLPQKAIPVVERGFEKPANFDFESRIPKDVPLSAVSRIIAPKYLEEQVRSLFQDIPFSRKQYTTAPRINAEEIEKAFLGPREAMLSKLRREALLSEEPIRSKELDTIWDIFSKINFHMGVEPKTGYTAPPKPIIKVR